MNYDYLEIIKANGSYFGGNLGKSGLRVYLCLKSPDRKQAICPASATSHPTQGRLGGPIKFVFGYIGMKENKN